jgi:TonB-dependent starch-binding outer membrane protein SusC
MIKQILWSEKRIIFLMLLLLLNFGLSNASKLAAAETVVSNELQQAVTVTGIVTDAGGGTLPGVSVVVKGTTNGTNTDVNGNYSLSNIPANSTLVFSLVGMKKKEIEIGSKTIINAALEDETFDLDQVIVVGYGSVKKSDLTGSISTVTAKDMKNTSVLSVDQALQGRSAGVLVTNNSGAPGSPVSVKIRGIGTFGNADPLYVVDGMPIKDATFGKNDNPSGINYLNPNDIESVQILKDASSAAIYGTRGANGVILITTKRGKSGKMKVDIDNYFGVQTLPKTMDMLNAQEYATLYNEGTLKTVNRFIPEDIPNLKTTDWINTVSRDAMVYNNQVSISGGSDNITLFLSVNNYKQDGIIQRTSYDRQSIRLNTDSKVNKWLKIGESLTLMQSNRSRPNEGGAGGSIYGALKADPTAAPFDSTGNWTYLPRTGSNPKADVDLYNYTYETTRIQGSLYAEIELFKNLKYKFNAGLDRSWGNRSEFFPTFSYSPVDQNKIPALTYEQETWNNWLIEHTLSYTYTKGKHDIGLLAGYTAQEEIKENVFNKIQLADNNPANQYLNNNTSYDAPGGGATEWGLISQLARLNYAYNDKYLLTASVRRDGSSRFGANKKYGVFPSWSLAWKVSNEEFFKNTSFLSDVSLLKMRFGWGQVGNQNIRAYAYNGSVSKKPDDGTTENGIYMGSTKALQPFYVDVSMANPEIGWETNITSNLGLDLGLWRNKLNFTMDLYDKTTQDLLMQKSMPLYLSQITPTSTDWGKPYVNLGEINNRGIELSLSYRNYDGEFKYEVSANFSKNINKVVALSGGIPPIVGNSTIVKEGQSLGTFYGYKTEGIFQDSLDIANHAFQANLTAPGDLKFKDLNGDGVINSKDVAYIGNAFPMFNYGLTINMLYKGFDLSIFTQGVSGNKIYNQLRQNVLYDFTLNSNVSTDLLNYWGRPLADGTTVTNTDVPRLSPGDKNANKRFSDYFLEDGSYFRIKSISLGYTFDKSVVNAIKLSNLRIYLTLQNVYTFTNYTGFDPEIGQSNGWGSSPLDFGVDSGTYPQAKMLMGGLNISF